MKRPATRGGGRKSSEIKVTRNSKRPQIKASRGPGGPVKQRKVAPSSRSRQAPRSVSESNRRFDEVRRQSLGSIGAAPPRRSPAAGGGRRASVGSGGQGGQGGSVRAVAAGGAAAAGALRVAQVAVRPARAVTRPALRVVSGGLATLPQAAGRATPIARGRALILLAGLMAAGLIYINVGKLEAGDGYSGYAARALELQRQNTILRSRIADLNSAARIQHYAEQRGMIVPGPDQYTYLKARRGDALKAARGYTAPIAPTTPSAGSTSTTGATSATGPSAATGAGR